MCGIIGIVSSFQEVGERVLHSIKRLEYRGYDSAGIATIYKNDIHVLKLAGKVKELETSFKKAPIKGNVGIGHTRWATHGAPTYANAHPLSTKEVAIVHNGIIENYLEIKQELINKGYKFEGETDTEVLTKLIQSFLDNKQDLTTAVKNAAAKAEGMYAFIALSTSSSNQIVGVKKGLPLALGIGENEMYFGSDAFALFPLTNKLIYLNDNEIAVITPTSYDIKDLQGNSLKKEIKLISIQDAEGKQHFDHYMLKEIYEQPRVIAQCFDKYYDLVNKSLNFKNLMDIDWGKVKKIYIIACGTSYFAGMVAKYWIELKAKLNVEVDLASEFRYRSAVLDSQDICIVISQSGETADTLAVLKYIKEKALRSIAVVNVTESSIGNLADYILPIHAGSEIGVASTKAFTCQLMVLALLTMHISHQRGVITDIELEKGLLNLHEASGKISESLSLDNKLKKLVKSVEGSKYFIYLGRGVSYPIAMEGALKIKEISYVPAEGIPAGELKHGPIALVDKSTPVCVIAPFDKLFNKTASNLQEVNARGGKVILFSSHSGIEQLKDFCFDTIELPDGDEFVIPLIYAIPLQLLAYHYAVSCGNDVDQPRNLAKSVTVE